MSNHDRLDPALHPIDGRRFSDPVAERTDWKPAHRGGANFRTHRMVQVEGRRIEFRPSHWSRLPNTIALLWGGGLLLALLADMTVAGDYTLIAGDGWAIAFASVCILFGWRSNFFRVEPAIFDLQSGLCWRGKRRPREPLSPQDQTRTARIPDIHALQLIGEVDMTAYLDLSPDGRRLLCTHLDGVVRLWEREEGRIVLSVMGDRRGDYDTWTPDGDWTESAGAERRFVNRVEGLGPADGGF